MAMMTPDEILARLLYRDAMMLVIDKPSGLPVHRGPRGAAAKAAGIEGALQDHFDALRFGLPRQPDLAHRLDRETAGCLVLGRHRKATSTLGDLFRDGKVGKTYWAVVEGGPDQDEGSIDLPLGKQNQDRGWWMKVDPDGLPSLTHWRVMGRAQRTTQAAAGDSAKGAEGVTGSRSLTWLALEPVTGRTHQLRVHCAAMGWPILGDSIYGTGPRFGGPGLHLLSREIAVPLYKNKPPVRVTATVPPHMREALTGCGWTGDADAPAAHSPAEDGGQAGA